MKNIKLAFFILTNPIFWIWAISIFLIQVVKKLLEVTGLMDWYFALFKLNTLTKEAKSHLVIMMETRKNKMFWLKFQAWNFALNRVKEKEN